MPSIDDKDFQMMAKIAQISQIGMEMAVPVGAGIGIDYWLNTLPWFTIVGAILGPALGFIHLLALLKSTDPRRTDQQ